MSNAKHKELLGSGRGTVGKTTVVGTKGRVTNKVVAKVVESANTAALVPFFEETATIGAKSIRTMPLLIIRWRIQSMDGYEHEAVTNSMLEFVRSDIHTNGVESFRSMLKRPHKSTFHKLSPKHLKRYVQEFATKHNMRKPGTLDQMRETVARFVGRQLRYSRLAIFSFA